MMKKIHKQENGNVFFFNNMDEALDLYVRLYGCEVNVLDFIYSFV